MIVRAVHTVSRLLDRPVARRFERAARDPAGASADRLRSFLERNADTAYGRAHGYHRIGSVPSFQDRIPMADGATLKPWIERIAAGEPRVLTNDPVVAMERTSGTTGGNRLVPYTDGFLRELRAALAPWLADLARALPALGSLRQYWSISPATASVGRTAGGVLVGFEDDTEYLGPFSRVAARRIMAVPPSVARIHDVDEWRTATLRHLLGAADLGLISVWSPSFLTLHMEALERDLTDYLACLPATRAEDISKRIEAAGRLTGEAVWPRLQVVSCWADGPAAGQLAALRRYFPATPIQGKGLLATEGVVSFPLWEHGGTGAVAAITSHFLEFIDLDSPAARPLLAHELRKGGTYSPVLTTGAGLARYHLRDAIRCTGHHGALPLLRFEGKLDQVSDRAGEKLNGARVASAIERLAREHQIPLHFVLLAPREEGARSRYSLFVDSPASDESLAALAAALDDELRCDHHYGHCRQLGQLGPIDARRIDRGWERYQQARMAAGARLGDIKPTALDPGTHWERTLARD